MIVYLILCCYCCCCCCYCCCCCCCCCYRSSKILLSPQSLITWSRENHNTFISWYKTELPNRRLTLSGFWVKECLGVVLFGFGSGVGCIEAPPDIWKKKKKKNLLALLTTLFKLFFKAKFLPKDKDTDPKKWLQSNQKGKVHQSIFYNNRSVSRSAIGYFLSSNKRTDR